MDHHNHHSDEVNQSPKALPSKYWQSLEEWEQNPDVLAAKSQEFVDTPLKADDRGEVDEGLARREFLKLMGASIAMASASGCARRPVEKIVPYVNQPVETVPGVASWYSSTCGECAASCGVIVKTREGRPIKLEGNPEHPMSQGGLCAKGQASVLNLYDPDRLQAPAYVDRGSKTITPATWDEADAKITDALRRAKAAGGKVRILTGELSGSTLKLVEEFASQFGNNKHVTYEPLAEEETALAQELSYGTRVFPRYNFEKARMIVSFGADFLGSWGSSVEYSKAFSKGRKVQKGTMSRFVAFEPHMTLTGSNADERAAVRPGDQLKVALALAHEIIVVQHQSRFAGDGAVSAALGGFSISQVAEETGVDAGLIKKTAHELAASRGTSLVVGGGDLAKGNLGVALEIVVNLLNSALENEGATVDGVTRPSHVHTSATAFAKLIEDMKNGQVDVLILSGVNPMYTTPKGLGFAEALEKVGLVISLNRHLDETAMMSHVACPDHHSLENWGDSQPARGVYSLIQPTVAPLYKTRALQDSLLKWQGRSGSWYEYLKAQWQSIQREVGSGMPFPLFWEESLRKGVVVTVKGEGSHPRSFKSSSLAGVAAQGKVKNSGPRLVLYGSIALGDGKNSNNSWLQELPDPVTKITWENYASLGVKMATQMGIKEGDIIRVRTETGALEIPAHIQPGNHADTVAIAVGYGRTRAGRVGNGLGVNGFTLLTMGTQAMTWGGMTVNIEKTGSHRKLATTQQHHSMEGRDIIRETTLDEFKRHPEGHHHKEHLVTMWSGHRYDGHKWGMAIDLSSCTGCGACVIACQAENNIPVVGYKDVLNGREMHWIRIDRYYSGTPENPETAYQPMICQHCENAPCETVCPVLATMHDNEGLNQQIYNRCVGTRYCANNCPYKVRRFNWFTYTDLAKSLTLQYNPEVTVRTRGVMEKCSFCTHRIRDAKGRAKDLGTIVKDGDITTACEQSCPTNAIVFGDLNNAESRVAQLASNPRGYHVLEEINVRPSVTYLTKVRNKESSAHDNHGQHHS